MGSVLHIYRRLVKDYDKNRSHLTTIPESVYAMFAMSKQITKAFRVESEAWANFVKAAESYGATPAELLRELVAHVDAAMKGIQSGEIKGFDGDVARLIKSEFPQLSPFQLKTMARILMQVSEMDEDSTSKEQPIN